MRVRYQAHHQRGSAILIAIISLGLLASLVHQLVVYASSLRSMNRTFRDGDAFRSGMREQVYSPSLTSRGCERQQLSMNGLSQTWFVCSHGAVPFVVSPAIAIPSYHLDYDALFANPIPCPGSRSAITERSFTTPIAPYSCTVSQLPAERTVLVDNLRAADIRFPAAQPNQAMQLSTPGEIRLTGTLFLSTDTIIASGGSLMLETIRNDTGLPRSVTLLSAHGDIVLNSVIGSISILRIGRQQISGPTTAPAVNYPLPPFRQRGTSGIIH